MSDNAPISVALTNLGRYNEGCLAFKWVNLPATTQQVQEAFREIGVDGIRYDEFFLTDYKTSIGGLHQHLHEYANLDELNYLANLVEDMSEDEKSVFEAALELDDNTGSIKDLINLAQNLDNYNLISDVKNAQDYGFYLIDECCCLEIPDAVQPYFDYEAYGRDSMMNDSGTLTDNGYVTNDGGIFIKYYDGDVPEEYRITQFPTPRGIEQMERAASETPAKDNPEPVR